MLRKSLLALVLSTFVLFPLALAVPAFAAPADGSDPDTWDWTEVVFPENEESLYDGTVDQLHWRSDRRRRCFAGVCGCWCDDGTCPTSEG